MVTDIPLVVQRLLAHKFEYRTEFKDYAILYRGNYQSRVFETALSDGAQGVIAAEMRYLIMDSQVEPSSTPKELQEQLHKTIVMVTHDPRAASRAHRTLHLDKGVLVDKPSTSYE